MSNVRKIMCHAEFPCPKCGKPFLDVSLAPWDDIRGIVGDAVQCGSRECNDCNRKERDAERAAYNKAQEQRRWQKKHKPLSGHFGR